MEVFIIILLVLFFLQAGNYSYGQYHNDIQRNEKLDDIADSNKEISKAIYSNLAYQEKKDAEERRLKFKKTLRNYEEM